MLQDVQTDAAIGVDVRVKHFGQELDFRRLVRIIFTELHGQVEAATLPDGVVRAKDHGIPVVQ